MLTTTHGAYRLSPFQWYDPRKDHRLRLGELLQGNRLDWKAVTLRAPLFDYLQPDADTKSTADVSEPENPAFDLTGHKGMLTQLALLAGARNLLSTLESIPRYRSHRRRYP